MSRGICVGGGLSEAVDCTGIINIAVVSSDPLFIAFKTLVRRRRINFFKAKIGGPKLIVVSGLKKIAKRIPALKVA